MNQKSTNLFSQFIVFKILIILFFILCIFAYFATDTDLLILNGTDHVYLEIISLILSFVIAFYLIMRGNSLNDKFSLFIGFGFFIAGIIDLLHGLFSFYNLGQSTFESYFIPQTWVAGRLLMGLMFMIALIKFPSYEKFSTTKSINFVYRYSIILGGIGATIISISLFQQLPFVTIDFFIKRPYEIVSAIFFIIGFAYFFNHKLHKKNDSFFISIVTLILIQIFVNIIISFSNSVFDTPFNFAHILKIVGYFIFIMMLSLSLSKNFKIEKTLNKELSNFQLSLDASSIVAKTDANGVITYVNDKFCKISKYSERELLGKNHNILKSGYHSPEFYKNMRKTISSGKTWFGEIKNLAKDGTYYWAKTTIIPFKNEYDEITHYVSVRTDITDQKLLTENLVKSERLRAIGHLAANMAHDIRNPLYSIKNSNQIIKKRINDEIGQNEIERINRSISRINHQITQVLDFIRLTPLKIEEISLIKTIKNVIKNLDLKTNITISLPVHDITINADKTKIESVFYNILFNAIQAIDTKKGKIIISIIEDDKNIKINFENDGPPIPEKILGQIFEPLFTTKQKGTGLGLASCKNLIEEHKGEISAKNSPNNGAIFTISLPKNSE